MQNTSSSFANVAGFGSSGVHFKDWPVKSVNVYIFRTTSVIESKLSEGINCLNFEFDHEFNAIGK